MRASREFQVFVKPIGAVCNLDCQYCYYLDKRSLYPISECFRMPDELLERYIVEHIHACPIPTVMFSWHGGEPTLLGLEYFRRIVELQRRHNLPGRQIVNGIQTNGTLLDEEWCRFLAQEHFYVGLSLDGPKEMHDGYRVTKRGKPTHDRVMRTLRLLQDYGVTCDTLCVLHDRNTRHPLELYRFFKEVGIRQMVFLPLVGRSASGTVTPESVTPEDFGTFLCAVFDEWIRYDADRIYVQWFEETMRPPRGLEHALCILHPNCGQFPVLEHNGDFYSCDHYVDRSHYLGNLRDKTLLETLDSPEQKTFGKSKSATLPRRCRRCDVLEYCNGGCPKDRFMITPEGEAGWNYLCVGLRRFFTHARPYAKRFARSLRVGGTIESFMSELRSADAGPRVTVGRNDPCPCGSGRKFKKCCLGK